MADTLSPSVFAFHDRSVRVLAINGEPWFIASDVAEALGYRDAANAARNLKDHQKGTHSLSTPGGSQKVTVITESGLYKLVLRSRKPEAEEFSDWVTGDVLPSIRKTGAYATPASTFTVPANISDSQRVALAYSLAAEVAAVASRTAFEAVLSGDDNWQSDHWIFSLTHGRDGKQTRPWAAPAGRDAILLTMAELTERIASGEMLQSSADLARLAAACNQRLVRRMSTAAPAAPKAAIAQA